MFFDGTEITPLILYDSKRPVYEARRQISSSSEEEQPYWVVNLKVSRSPLTNPLTTHMTSLLTSPKTSLSCVLLYCVHCLSPNRFIPLQHLSLPYSLSSPHPTNSRFHHRYHNSHCPRPFTLDYCKSLYHSLPITQIKHFNTLKMDVHVLLLALPNILTSPQCSSPFIGSKLNNGFNIRSSPLHTTSSI